MTVLRKISQIIVISVFLIPTIVAPVSQVKAKTLGDLKSDLQKKQNELSDNKHQQELTNQQINSINATITSIEGQITQTYTDIAALNADIESLNNQIAEKQKQVKEIVNFIQVANGESAYLEYAFGAQDFTDFIYRISVAEQLAKYNEKLVDDYNNMIEENKKKQKEIEDKRVSLGTQQENLTVERNKLGEELKDLENVNIDISDDIEYQKEIIELYRSKGCKDNEDIATCGRSVLPQGTAFYRPTVSGHVTSEWGYRNLSINGGWHEGLDIGISEGTPVYAIGTGMVAAVMVRNSCGGNMVVVHHNINGKGYTSVYAHLLSISVGKNQVVDRNTIIGYSGGYSTSASLSGSYDRCSLGAHLHLTVANGYYGDYSWYQMNYTYSINPRTVINFPSGRNSWTDRLTAY